MNGLRSAIGLLTVLPGASDGFDARAAVAWYVPVSIAVAGTVAAVAAGCSEVWSGAGAAALTVAAWAIVTGALHLDGLADTADGALAAVPPERRLEIMRDVHNGTFGTVAVALVLLLKFGALAGLSGRAMSAAVFAAVPAARLAGVVSMKAFRSARAGGMGAAAREGAAWTVIACGVVLAGGAGFVAFGWAGLVLAVIVVGAALLAAAWLAGRLGGLTGDCYGAVIELTEVLAVLAASALFIQGDVEGWETLG
jgi:adenosylcobinamide-GDP ribazoletransferase